MTTKFLPALIAAVIFSASAFAEHTHDHKAPHGGMLLEVGDHIAHIEFIHDDKAGKVTLHILGANAKTPISLKETPKINVKSIAGNKQVDTRLVESKDGTSSHFEASDEALKMEPLVGRISLTLQDKKYDVEILDDHKVDAKKDVKK